MLLQIKSTTISKKRGMKLGSDGNKKLVLAFDIDEVVVDFLRGVIDVWNSSHGTAYSRESMLTNRIEDIFGIPADEAWNNLKLVYERGDYLDFLPVKDSKEFISDAVKQGAEIHFVTARSYLIENETKRWFSKYFPELVYELHLLGDGKGGLVESKGERVKKIQADFFFEDQSKHARDVSEKGVAVFLVDNPWNHDLGAASEDVNIIRIKSIKDAWRYIEE